MVARCHKSVASISATEILKALRRRSFTLRTTWRLSLSECAASMRSSSVRYAIGIGKNLNAEQQCKQRELKNVSIAKCSSQSLSTNLISEINQPLFTLFLCVAKVLQPSSGNPALDFIGDGERRSFILAEPGFELVGVVFQRDLFVAAVADEAFYVAQRKLPGPKLRVLHGMDKLMEKQTVSKFFVRDNHVNKGDGGHAGKIRKVLQAHHARHSVKRRFFDARTIQHAKARAIENLRGKEGRECGALGRCQGNGLWLILLLAARNVVFHRVCDLQDDCGRKIGNVHGSDWVIWSF